jgi:hypothetical protein
MSISIADRSLIADALADLMRDIDTLIHQGGSKRIGKRLERSRTALLALLAPSGERPNFTRNSDILGSQFSLDEKVTLYQLWGDLRPGQVWCFDLRRTPELVLARFARILAVLRKADSSGADSDQVEAEQIQATPRARGRRRRYDRQRDQAIAEAWRSAHDRGVSKKDFVRDLRPKHTLLQLNRLLNRVRKSQSRAE